VNTNRVAPRLRVVNARLEAEIVNPYPCRCCVHGHELAAVELVVRRRSDGVVLKTLRATAGGFEETA
jgi:hypothetical protein